MQAHIDLSTLSAQELAIMVRLGASGRKLRAASSDGGETIEADMEPLVTEREMPYNYPTLCSDPRPHRPRQNSRPHGPSGPRAAPMTSAPMASAVVLI